MMNTYFIQFVFSFEIVHSFLFVLMCFFLPHLVQKYYNFRPMSVLPSYSNENDEYKLQGQDVIKYILPVFYLFIEYIMVVALASKIYFEISLVMIGLYLCWLVVDLVHMTISRCNLSRPRQINLLINIPFLVSYIVIAFISPK